ncbi:MAG: peptidoglycan recognition protein family protein [candidate division KSB1 bacterium]|nr:peptidoglycan recognition protein family protein [candidate division KSB1 bacterium]MDZ7304587.1 peptidoglycan recognition protein family protein [candidate division KSB1 bacterium]MDZ7313619.1 peptidoglycan recognition protein family protein [candidate division KSB1 bacterium]
MNSAKIFFLLFVLFFGLHCALILTGRIKHLDREVITVAQWGGTPAQDASRVHTIKFITLHHGGEEFKPDQDFATYLINLQNWSRTEKKWIDIPYHYLIDFDGKIYEGRNIHYPGDTNTAYDPTGHALVCVPGNYEVQQPNEKQLRAVVNIFTWLCWKYKLSPEVIKGHKDVADGTVCPGKNLYVFLENGYFQKEVMHQLEELQKK